MSDTNYNTAYIILAYIVLLLVFIFHGRTDSKVRKLEAEAKSLRYDISILYVEKQITESRLKSIENSTVYKTLKESK
jgi:hypothetical protein